MNKTTLLALLLPLSLLGQEKPAPDFQQPTVTQEVLPTPTSYRYFCGSIGILPGIGAGYRTRDIDAMKGNDYSAKYSLMNGLVAGSGSPIVFLPAIKYTRLYYKSQERESRYFGVGYELLFGFIPNIELIWGKEYSSNKFGQFELSLGPLVYIPCSAILTPRVSLSDSPVIAGSALAVTTAMFSYTVSF